MLAKHENLRLRRHLEDARCGPKTAHVAAAPNETTVPARAVVDQNYRWYYRLFSGFADEGWNFVLGTVAILLAILLGWMIGRGERHAAMQTRVSSARAAVSQPHAAVTPESPDSTDALQQPIRDTSTAASSGNSASQIRDSLPTQDGSSRHRTNSKRSAVELITSRAPLGDIVIFDNGKPTPVRSPASTAGNEPRPSNSRENSTSEEEYHQPTVSVSEAVAEQHLLERIEPDYPDSVRAKHLQGAVILNIYVGKNGTVRSLSCVTGDSELCLLAANAVRQWKFSTLIHKGAPASFESQTTIEFALP